MLYYGHHYGWDRNARNQFKDHPCLIPVPRSVSVGTKRLLTPTTPQPLSHFEPLLHDVFARKAYDPAVIREGEALGSSFAPFD